MNANESRLADIKEKGQELIDAGHYAKDDVQNRLDEIDEEWTELKIKAEEKGKFITFLYGCARNKSENTLWRRYF